LNKTAQWFPTLFKIIGNHYQNLLGLQNLALPYFKLYFHYFILCCHYSQLHWPSFYFLNSHTISCLDIEITVPSAWNIYPSIFPWLSCHWSSN
jgi:hypothetical protein